MRLKLIVLSILALIPLSVSADITTELVGYWSFNEGEGSSAADSSGSGYTGTLNHGATWGEGKFGSGMYFDGANTLGQSVSANVPGTTTLSYSFWLKHDAERGDFTQNQFILSQSVGGANACISVTIGQNQSVSPLVFLGQVGTMSVSNAVWNALGAADEWTHIVATNNPDVDESRLYINGTLMATSTALGCTQGFNDVLFIGEEPQHGINADYNGLLDDVRVYHRALTSDDVAELYAWEPIDTMPPTITITSPENATTTLTRYITLSANVTDDTAVHDVQFYIDGEAVGDADVSAPYSRTFDTTTIANGEHELTVVARDTTLNSTTTSPLTFTVQNPLGPDYYVTTTGTSTGNGSTHDPWDIETAFENIETLDPGSIIWILEGVYTPSTPYGFAIPTSGGVADEPIIVRNYNNERVVLDGGLSINADNVWIWGLEITTYTDFPSLAETRDEQNEGYANGTYPTTNLTTGGDNLKIINSIMHNNPQSHGSSAGGTNIEYYGNLFLNTGRNSATYPSGHAAYIQNDIGYKRFVNNIVGNSFLNGFNLYSGGVAPLNNVFLRGNILFGHRAQGNILVGSDNPVEGLEIVDNVLHNNGTYNYHNMSTGYGGSLVVDMILKNNMFVGGGAYLKGLTDGYTVTYNKMFQSILIAGFTGDLENGTWGYNTYEATTQNPFTVGIYPLDTNVPFETWVTQGRLENPDFEIGTTFSQTYDTRTASRVYPNMFESGRGHVAIMNLDEEVSIDVDLSSVLMAGDAYTIRPVQNYYVWDAENNEYDYGSSTSGVYDGISAAFPMTGWDLSEPKTSNEGEFITTFPTFGTFVVERTATSTLDVVEPLLSAGTPDGYIGNGYATTTLAVTTDENALCKFSTTADTSFNFMLGLFDATGTTTHTLLLEDLEDDTEYTYYVRCRDRSDNVTTDDYEISFMTGDEPLEEEEEENPENNDDEEVVEDDGGGTTGGSSRRSSVVQSFPADDDEAPQSDTFDTSMHIDDAMDTPRMDGEENPETFNTPSEQYENIDMRLGDYIAPDTIFTYTDSSSDGMLKTILAIATIFGGAGIVWWLVRLFV